MFEIVRPFSIRGIPTKPEMSGRPKLDETIIQTLASLMGWDGESRRLITCAINGALQTVAPIASVIANTTGSGANDDITFPDTPTSEIMIMANANNSGDVWVNIGAAAAVDTGYQTLSKRE